VKKLDIGDNRMKRIGIVGVGDMGIGIASNLLKNGYELTGFDLREDRRERLEAAGGSAVTSAKAVAESSDVIFVMVLSGSQLYAAVAGQDGLLAGAKEGSTIIVTATVKPSEVRSIAPPAREKGVHLIDTPVSGGKSGADNGTLTLMAAAPKDVFDSNRDILEAIGANIFHVGTEIGEGQTVKAALQALIGASFTAIFESLVLGTKAGADPEVLYDVFASSAVGSPLFKNCAQLIMDRKFKGTGSHIGTMYKDICISMEMAQENGVPMFTTASAHELFQAGISKFPEEDNWSIIKILEDIAGTEVARNHNKK
jgi:3-hydroxyisobutyrate dehydrogenase-like beta-hydroxyacid dehydrogenase